jgi:hypothetical protein
VIAIGIFLLPFVDFSAVGQRHDPPTKLACALAWLRHGARIA